MSGCDGLLGARATISGGDPIEADVAIVGAGILGLAHAYVLAKRGKKVVVFERGHRALGASVRNFGMIWPVGQPPGEMREIAARSRELWVEVLEASRLWYERTGSLHLAYHQDELDVLDEFVHQQPSYGASIIGPEEAARRSPVIRPEGLMGAMWSPTEICVNPREIVAKLPTFLETLGVEFRFGTVVTSVRPGGLCAGGDEWSSPQILLCTGDDFETLFPDVYKETGMTRCKLQMLRARPLRPEYRIGTHLCAGLTLGHYSNFRGCRALEPLLERFGRDWPDQVRWGVHLLVSQHENGDLTIGDSHEYGLSPDPFLREEIDRLILAYLDTFLPRSDFEVIERWHGVYAKHPSKGYVVAEPSTGVRAITGVGGAGMTLSFGLAENTAKELA